MQPDRAMMEVVTEHGREMRAVDHVEHVDGEYLNGHFMPRIGMRHPSLREDEIAFPCLDGTVYVVKGAR